jgi:asparagine synthase (glutamine-hydrolysing)
MCGINGLSFPDKDLILRMNGAIRHRGPDGTGCFIDERVSLGHNLLAITEVPANSGQPVVSDDFVMLYNGEIYNYRILREELSREGDRFMTDSDTEVLFAGLARHGERFFERLDGMFAVAWYDRRADTLVLARDPAGIKPLYWSVSPRGLIFSSELRGMFAAGADRVLDAQAVDLYLALGYVPGPSTLVAGIRKVCPGQYLRYHVVSGTCTTEWIQASRDAVLQGNVSEQVRTTIGASARGQTMGLRPFGLYLSGGLDSSILLHEIAHGTDRAFKTYTTRFDISGGDFNDDADLAQRLCTEYGVEHDELLVREDEYADAYVHALAAIEEPRWNPSIGAYWLLAGRAAKDITVVLNGSGGDELFFGYPRYRESRHMSDRYARYPQRLVDLWYTVAALRRGRISLGRMMHLNRPLERWAYLNRITDRGSFTAIVEALGRAGYPSVQEPLADIENAVAELDRLFWLADEEYIRTDKLSMQVGMEGRFPLMGREVIALANALPSAMKLREGTSKSVLREAYRGHLPEYIINKKKTGWRAPVAHWMQGKFGMLVKESLSEQFYSGLHGILDGDAIRKKNLDGVTHFSIRTMKSFLPAAALQIWAREFKITS